MVSLRPRCRCHEAAAFATLITALVYLALASSAPAVDRQPVAINEFPRLLSEAAAGQHGDALSVPPTVAPNGVAPPTAPVETHVNVPVLGVQEPQPAGAHGQPAGGSHGAPVDEHGNPVGEFDTHGVPVDAHGQPITTAGGHELTGEFDGEPGHGEEHHFGPAEGGLSFTLICIVMISLLLFFFLNSEDADIVAYTWDILGKGTNVFVSVMIFLIIVEICEAVWPRMTFAWCTGVMGVICIGLIFANLKSIRASNREVAIGVKKQRFRGEVNYEKITKKVIWSMTFGRIQAHLAAFTMIFFWGHLQHDIYDRHLFWGGDAWSTALVVPAAGLFHLVVMASLSCMRKTVASTDGQIDEDERLWLHGCDETDIEAGGLELAFLAMQAIRFGLTGVIPSPNGSYHGRVPDVNEGWWLLGLCFITGSLSLVLRRILSSQRARARGRKPTEESEESDEEEGAGRKRISPALEACFSVAELVLEFLSFLCGWALFFTFDTWVRVWDAKGRTKEIDVMLIRTAIALMCSAVVFTIVCCMDKIVDVLDKGRVDVGKEAEVIISVVGMMMGFAWERCFHHAFEVASGGVVEALHQKLGLHFLFSELGVFVVTCGVMSLATILVLFWYINPRSLESRAKARFDKAHPGGLLREPPLATELEDSYAKREATFDEEPSSQGWFTGLFSSKPPQLQALESQRTSLQRAELKDREVVEPLKTYQSDASASTARRTYASVPVQEEARSPYIGPPRTYYSVNPSEAEEALPFPKQRRTQEDYLAGIGTYGQAPWASRPYAGQAWGTVPALPPPGSPGGPMQPGLGPLPPTAGSWPPVGSPVSAPPMLQTGPVLQPGQAYLF